MRAAKIEQSAPGRRKFARIHRLVIRRFAVHFDEVDQHQSIRWLAGRLPSGPE
jgi:hypothetical protein